MTLIQDVRKSFQCQATPDTGATKTVLTLDIKRKNNIQVSPTNERLFVANSEEMPCEGTFTFMARVNSVETRIEALVTSLMNNEILICWQDLISLGVIPQNFPCNMYQINREIDTSRLTDIFRNFDDVLNDRVKLKAMKGQPMHIYLHEDAGPETCWCRGQYLFICKRPQRER